MCGANHSRTRSIMKYLREVDRAVELLLQRHRWSVNKNGCQCGLATGDNYYRHVARLVIDEVNPDE